jgi:SOS-response transcriptional repressor LexA
MSSTVDKSLILNEIKSHYGHKSDAEFATFLGIAPTTLSSWHKRNSIDYDLVYSKCEGISGDFLFTGKGEAFPVFHQPDQQFLLKTDSRKEIQRIPLFDTLAAASFLPTFGNNQNIIDYITIPNMPSCDGALPITGDSMYPLLRSGDIVLYKVVQDIEEGIYWGEMYLIYLQESGDDMTICKYVQKSDKGDDYIKIVSYNTHHAPKDVKLKKVKAMALVKASIRINSMS